MDASQVAGDLQVSPVSRMTGDGTSFEKNCSVREPGVGGGGKNGLQVGTVDGSEIRLTSWGW